MGSFKRLIDVVAQSDRPIRRLLAYYAMLAGVFLLIAVLFPQVGIVFSGERLDELSQAPQVLRDGLAPEPADPLAGGTMESQMRLALSTLLTVFGTLALMLPVSWVYTSRRQAGISHDQTIAQTLLILPIVVAGIILIVQNSLALAFSLAGVVAAVRFRTKLDESRDTVFIFLAIAVGFAAGVQELMVGAIISASFNFLLLFVWHSNFGGNALDTSAAAQWNKPLTDLASKGDVADRDLALALSPAKAETLAERFTRVHELLGSEDKKPRYNAVLSLSANSVPDAQKRVEPVLEKVAKRWKLDEVVNHDGKPGEIFYLVRLKKDSTPADLITAVRTRAGNRIVTADVEVGESLAKAANGNGQKK